jgi:hypothetical protein
MPSLLFLVASAAAAQAPRIVVEAPPAKERPVCRTERSTGSRVVKQICKSRAEQAKDDLEAKNKLRLGNRSNRPPDAFKDPAGN